MIDLTADGYPLFERLAPMIRALPDADALTRDQLLVAPLRLYANGPVSMYYGPFEHVNVDARLVLIGITPSWRETAVAYREARRGLLGGLTADQCLARVKQHASFAGPMRASLVRMLDGLGVQRWLGVPSTDALFREEQRHLVHVTAAIRYPVFVRGGNYNGHGPRLLSTPLFTECVEALLGKELERVTGALVVPLGKAVEGALRYLVERRALEPRRCLFGFPHPSPANGHRWEQYAAAAAAAGASRGCLGCRTERLNAGASISDGTPRRSRR